MYYILKAKCTTEDSISLSKTAVPHHRYEPRLHAGVLHTIVYGTKLPYGAYTVCKGKG